MGYSFKNLEAYQSNRKPARWRYAPEIGEDYQLTVEYDVTGNPLGDYHVTLDLADQSYAKTIFKNNTGHQVITHNFGDLPLDDEIPWEVQVDPYDTAGGADPTQSPIKPKIPTPIGGNSDIAVAGKQPSLKPVAKTKLTGTLVPQPPDKGGVRSRGSGYTVINRSGSCSRQAGRSARWRS